jgi:hypothetical protein
VDLRRQTLPDERIKGGAQMRRMALGALAALAHADLGDAAQLLQERLFKRNPDALVERYEENNVWSWRFKPMAELLLLELTYLASDNDLSPDERRDRIEWAIEMSGF